MGRPYSPPWPIADAVEALTGIRNKDLPRETDAVLDIVRGDMDNVRRLVERALNAALLSDLDAIEAAMEGDVRKLGDELRAVLTTQIAELEQVRRPGDGSPAPTRTGTPAAPVAEPLPVIHINSTGPDHAAIRKNPPPNTIIVIDEGAVYTTDDQGRVVLVKAT